MADETPEVPVSKTVVKSEDGHIMIAWQDQPVKAAGGKNGADVGEILALCSKRLAQLDDEVPCEETKVARAKVKTAIGTLEIRTKRRTKQGVEGSKTPHDSNKV